MCGFCKGCTTLSLRVLETEITWQDPDHHTQNTVHKIFWGISDWWELVQLQKNVFSFVHSFLKCMPMHQAWTRPKSAKCWFLQVCSWMRTCSSCRSGLWWEKSNHAAGRNRGISSCKRTAWPSGTNPRRPATPNPLVSYLRCSKKTANNYIIVHCNQSLKAKFTNNAGLNIGQCRRCQ